VEQSRHREDVPSNEAFLNSKLEELVHTISSMQAQQTCLLKALEECQALVSTEMVQMQAKAQDYAARCKQASAVRLLTWRDSLWNLHARSSMVYCCMFDPTQYVSASSQKLVKERDMGGSYLNIPSGRGHIGSQLEEQKEEILHIEKGIVHPCIEDMVLIAQVHGLVEKLLESREKQSVQMQTLQTSQQHLEDGSSFLHRIHALLQDCASNLKASQFASFSPEKAWAKDCDSQPATRTADQLILLEDASPRVRKADQGGEINADVVRVAAELEDACMELNW